MKKLRVRAVMTVEASLLMPIVIICIIIMIFLSYYVYNGAAINGIVIKELSSFTEYKNKNAVNKIKDNITTEIDDNIIAMPNYKCSVTDGSSKITVTVTGEFKIPFVKVINDKKIHDKLLIQTEENSLIIKPVKFIWDIKKAKELISKND